ncbi:MAG: hypothetical protein M1828_002219 [Chrysothrix sp. TS-e1954]|nr:MAG: hypothetical protein M1828_002219 [Chrysothrix sp. TS-e1954]
MHLVKRCVNVSTPQLYDIGKLTPFYPGRSLRDCQDEFHDLGVAPFRPAPFYQAALPGVAPRSTLPRSDPLAQSFGTRPYVNTDPLTTLGRTIQPRPQGLAHAAHSAPTGSSSPTTTEPPPRKRGRPSNVDAEARKQHYAALGQDVPTPKRPPRRTKAPKTSGGSVEISSSAARPTENEAETPSGGSTSRGSPSKDLAPAEPSGARLYPPDHLRLPSMDHSPAGRPYEQSQSRMLHPRDEYRPSYAPPTSSSSNLALPHLLPASKTSSEAFPSAFHRS